MRFEPEIHAFRGEATRNLQWETPVGEEKAHIIHVGGGKSKEVSSRSALNASPPSQCRGS